MKSRVGSKKKKRIAQYIISYFFLILLSIFFLFPIYCLLIKSIMPDDLLLKAPSLLPTRINLEPYHKALNKEYLRYFANTFIVCISNVLGVTFAGSFTAYGLSKVKFKGQNVVFTIILSTVLLPSTVTSISLYTMYSKLGWTSSLIPLIVPIWFGGGAMNIFLMRQFMKGIPNSYVESAIIDGASSFRIYWNIILPLIKPIVIYLGVVTFMNCWNDFQGPLMYVSTDKANWTISLALYKNFANQSNATNLPNVQMATGVLMMAPCVVLYSLFQKELMEGVASIGVKG